MSKQTEFEITREAIEYVCNYTKHFNDIELVRKICELRLKGWPYVHIGREVFLSSGRCQQIVARVIRIYESAKRNGKINQEVIWRWEYGLCMPFCPYCNEPAYEEDRCVFCHREYKYTESPVKDTKVTVGEYTVIQLSNNALYVFKGERCVMHASSAKKMTEDELREMVDLYGEMKGGE